MTDNNTTDPDAEWTGGLSSMHPAQGKCPECGWGLHEIRYEDERERRCATDSCPVGWLSEWTTDNTNTITDGEPSP